MVRTAKLTTPLFRLRREIDRLFEDSFGNVDAPSFMTSGWMPLVDVKETNEALLFNLELPGVAEDKLEITCEGGVLTVSGEKETLKKDEEDKFHIVERSFGMFRRSFQLPTNVQEDKIEATVKDGILAVKVPKMELPKPKKIEVKAIKG
ncbi:MAG: Hsp20/alpha crystallin family protein [Gemmatimonadota bacterium]